MSKRVVKKVAILGAGDLGQQIAHYIGQSETHQVVGFYDDYAYLGENRSGTSVLGSISQIVEIQRSSLFDELLIGIGYKHLPFRQELFKRLSTIHRFSTFIHPACTIDSTANVGVGSVLFPGVHLDHKARIKDNVVVNIGATISHDSVIGNHCFVSPRVAIAGFTEIGDRCILGINSTVIDNVKIACDVQLGAGAVVINNLREPGLYIGVPARFSKPK